MHVFSSWSNFYITTGSAAASLTGLMFVVITLVMGQERIRRSTEGIAAFSTPTVLHFATALLISVIFNVPWNSLVAPAVLAGLVGLNGIIFLSDATIRAIRLREYSADISDWCWYTILPFVAYVALLVSAVLIPGHAHQALFGLAGSVILLIFIGIRNAWDIVTFIVTGGPNGHQSSVPPPSS